MSIISSKRTAIILGKMLEPVISTSRARQTLALLAILIFSVIYWTPYIIFTALTFKKYCRRFVSPVTRCWGRTCLALLGIDLNLQNTELLDDERARIVVANHQSSLDMLWMAALLPPRTVAVGKVEIKYIPFANLIWWAAGFLLLPRENHDEAMEVLEHLEAILQAGENCTAIIAPEGTRSPDGKLHDFKKGAFVLSMRTALPIYPVVVSGAATLLPKHHLIPQSGTISVNCLPPLESDYFSEDTLDEDIKNVEEMYNEFLDEEPSTVTKTTYQENLLSPP